MALSVFPVRALKSTFLSLAILSSCQLGPIAREDLVGFYKLDALDITGYLELREDGFYAQKVTLEGGLTKEAWGKWDYAPPQGDSVNRGVVIIYGPVLEREGVLRKYEPTFIKTLPVHGSHAKLYLYISPDGNEAYVKQ